MTTLDALLSLIAQSEAETLELKRSTAELGHRLSDLALWNAAASGVRAPEISPGRNEDDEADEDLDLDLDRVCGAEPQGWGGLRM